MILVEQLQLMVRIFQSRAQIIEAKNVPCLHMVLLQNVHWEDILY